MFLRTGVEFFLTYNFASLLPGNFQQWTVASAVIPHSDLTAILRIATGRVATGLEIRKIREKSGKFVESQGKPASSDRMG